MAILGKDRSGGGDLLMMNAEFLRFAARWGFMPRACRPYRVLTKGRWIDRSAICQGQDVPYPC